MNRTLRILGTRGVPAAHGGFETFAEELALYLVKRGWRVIVYCQEDGSGPISESTWNGVERITIPISQSGPKGTILFDWKSIRHAARTKELCLTLGYNTAILCGWLRLCGVRNLINMDGMEWRRAKWGKVAKTWFWLNDWAGCFLGDHLVADHPEIAHLLERRVSRAKITTIPYGAQRVTTTEESVISAFGLESNKYLTVVARAEPENSVLEIVKGFSVRRRGVRLVILGNYYSHRPYHVAVKAAASDEVLFLGAIYNKPVLQALRVHSLAYLHGHQVGGTNPSLVEALGAGNAVIAHDNKFNRWVAGSGARYFKNSDALSAVLDELLPNAPALESMRKSSVSRFEGYLTWDNVLRQYETLLEAWLPSRKAARRAKITPSLDTPDPIDISSRIINGEMRVDGTSE